MKISVLIIAHNEEEWIKRCIESILNQTQKPDEIVLIAHNCTDGTIKIAQNYPEIKLVKYDGPVGIPYARIKGFETVTGDIICCTDGDAWADKNWLKNIVKPLILNPEITIVGGRLIMENNFFWKVAMFKQFLFRKFLSFEINQFASGANFACRKVDYEKVSGFEPIIELKNKLNMYFWAEDVYISQALRQIGKLYIAWDAIVHTKMSPEQESISAQKTLIPKWRHDNKAILNYFKNKNS
jgi:glycosyltransferase involved in cell wall biosynthesis